MFRRGLAARGFDEAFFVMADLEMWFHLLEQGCFAYLEEPLCAFRKHRRQQTEKDRSALAPALENRELLRRYLDRRYVRLRRWIRRYLEYDAVRRIVRRSKKLRAGQEQAAEAIREFGGLRKYRAKAPKHIYRESCSRCGACMSGICDDRGAAIRERVQLASTFVDSRRAFTASANHHVPCGRQFRRVVAFGPDQCPQPDASQ